MKKGFTLIELLAVIVILGIVVAIAIPGINLVITNSRKKTLESEVQIIHSAALRKYAENSRFNFNKVNKDNLKEHLEIDGSKYDYISISNINNKVSILLKKEGLNVKTDGKKTYSSNLPPHVIFEFDLSLGASFVNIDDADLLNEKIYVYSGSFINNKNKISNGLNSPDYFWTDLTYQTDLRDKLNKTSGVYTVIATKFSKTGGSTATVDRVKNAGLIGIPYFDLKGLNTTNIRFLFYYATNFNQNINDWDVSNVVNLGYLFDGATKFNQPLNSWDVSKVNTMYATFRRATNFNQDLSNWDTNRVLSFYEMFNTTINFNQDIGMWNTSFATHMGKMFYKATNFSQDLSSWDITRIVSYSDFSFESGLLPEQLPNFN